MEEFIKISPEKITDLVLGPLGAEIFLDGELIKKVNFENGYLHRGMEKIFENMSYVNVIPLVDRLDYSSALFASWAYVLSIENALKIKVPERAEIIRVIVGELARISNHILSIGVMAKAVGSDVQFNFSQREKEHLADLFEMLSGARVIYGYMRIGGVAHDITEGFIEKTIDFVDKIYTKIKELNELLSYNTIFLDRTLGVGVISKEQAISLGISGPCLRGSGVDFDIRKKFPYSVYSKIEFEVPIGVGEKGVAGDVFSRYIVRLREIEQSLKIIRQCVYRIPIGPYVADVDRDLTLPEGVFVSSVESPKGEFSVVVESNGKGNKASRIHFRTPSLLNLKMVENLLSNTHLDDFSVILASGDINVSEVDK